MACRTMLLKLERRGIIDLPPARKPSNNDKRTAWTPVLHETIQAAWASRKRSFRPAPIDGRLSDVTPVKVQIIQERYERELFKSYMNLYHYLGLNTLVGENLQYIIKSRDDVPLACLLFGAAAWKTDPRDRFIGWGQKARERNLYLIANNHRYLIFPWVRIKFLASHILSLIVKRLSDDWLAKYHHKIVLAETFVECDRFSGTCYKAAGAGRKLRLLPWSHAIACCSGMQPTRPCSLGFYNNADNFSSCFPGSAQGKVIHNDDTKMKVLSLMKENKLDPDRKRKGIFTSGFISRTDNFDIALYYTGRNTAGENLKELLQLRDCKHEVPIQMCDASSNNEQDSFCVMLSNCLTHGRRKFVDMIEAFPQECIYIIEATAVRSLKI